MSLSYFNAVILLLILEFILPVLSDNLVCLKIQNILEIVQYCVEYVYNLTNMCVIIISLFSQDYCDKQLETYPFESTNLLRNQAKVLISFAEYIT